MTRRTGPSKNAYDDSVRAYMSTNTRPFVQMHFEREIRAKKEQSMEKIKRFGSAERVKTRDRTNSEHCKHRYVYGKRQSIGGEVQKANLG